MCTDYKMYSQKAILKYLIGLRNFPCGSANVTALFHFSFFVLVVFGLLLNRNWIHKGFPRLTETLFGNIRILFKWLEMCSVFHPRPHQEAESTELPKMAVVRQFGLLVWKNYIQQVSCGERGGEQKLYYLIRCWHCLWLSIVTGGCIYGVGSGRRVFLKLHPHSAIINTANWLTVWFQLMMLHSV